MRYRRLKKAEGIRLFKNIIFPEIALDFLHNSKAKGTKQSVENTRLLRSARNDSGNPVASQGESSS